MKKLLRRILPASLWNKLRYAKRLLKTEIKILLHLPLKKKKDMLGFRFHVAEHCNLNCKGCNNFSPLAEPELVDVGELRRDLARLGEIFGHKCKYIYLSGGEPLLHQEIISIMKITRENFPDCYISIFTNGILLSQQGDDFWKACHDSKVNVISSAYPININVDKIREIAGKFGVSFSWAWGEEESKHDKFAIEPINLKGDSNIKRNFAICGRANNCITLRKGRLYTCTFAPHVRHFNRYFGQNVAITEADSVNIYDDNITADMILQRLAEPIPACRYCNLNAKIVQWGISERDISEWA